MPTQISPRSEVSPKAEIADDVTIGPFTIIEEGAVIGEGTSIDANALIGKGARIGRNCHIHHAAVVGHAPQDLKYKGEPTTCEIGDRTVIREFAALHRGTPEGGGRTIIGSDCFIMGFVHIAHDCQVGNRVILANAAMLSGHVHVGDHATLGGLLAVHQFVRIGRHCMVGGGIRVGKDVPPYVLASHGLARFVGLNHVGLRRRGFTRETLDALDRAYEIIYRSKLNVTQALLRLKTETELLAVPEVREVVAFVEQSKRGIIAAPRLGEE